MPLVKRDIEPQYISRVVVAPGVRNELEFVANATLGHVVAQLSSLSKHAEDLFSELHRDTSCIFYRSCKLNERIDRLKQKIQQLNPVKETVSLQDMNMRKPFKSSVTKEQQILTLHSRPQAITDRYKEIETPPPLNKLDAYREDGKDSLKFYTDPGYFLELWCQEMVKDADNQHKKQKRNKRARPVKEPRTIRAPKSHLDEFKDRRHGPEFVGLSIGKEPIYGNISVEGQPFNRPVSLEISTPTQPNQWDIVGHGFPTAEYGLVIAGTMPRSGSVADSNLGPISQNTLPGNRSESVELYPVDQIGNHHAGAQSNRSTPSKQAKQLAHDSSLRQHRNHYGDASYVSGDGRVQTGRDTMSPRPALPPPAPPDSTEQRRGTPQAVRTASVVHRDNLPPPPPAPVQQVIRSESTASKSGRHPYPPANYGGQEQAPTPTSPKGMLNNSFELPPPPTPPPLNNTEMIPSPPSIPPPPMEDAFSPPPPPLPPPLELGHRLNARKDMKVVPEWENNNDLAPVDSASLASDTSSATVSSKNEEKPAIRDTRSDLLSAIRTGINLRKVEERRLKTEQKQNTSVKGFDVQAIMEAAFERRRKALEENDSDKDDDEDADGNWSDEG